MRKEKSCGCIIIFENKVLLIKQVKAHWGFPKGHVELNETEHETAIREVKEETNIDVEIVGDYRYEEKYIIDNEIEKTVIYFLAKPTSLEIKNQECEVSEIEWLNFKDAFERITYDNSRKLLEKVLKDLNIEI